jgi:hypothetical protein
MSLGCMTDGFVEWSASKGGEVDVSRHHHEAVRRGAGEDLDPLCDVGL